MCLNTNLVAVSLLLLLLLQLFGTPLTLKRFDLINLMLRDPLIADKRIITFMAFDLAKHISQALKSIFMNTTML